MQLRNLFHVTYIYTKRTYDYHCGCGFIIDDCSIVSLDIGNLTIIGSDNGLSPGQRQAIIWTNAGILLIGPLGTNFNEILFEIRKFSSKKMNLKMSSAKWRPFCLCLNVLTTFFTMANKICETSQHFEGYAPLIDGFI